MKPSTIVGFFLLAFVAIFGLSWLAQGNDWFMYKVFAPKYEAVRRETFEQSKAYNQGVVQELNAQYIKYQSATPSEKDAIASVALHQVADYPVEKLPSHLRVFVQELRTRMNGTGDFAQ